MAKKVIVLGAGIGGLAAGWFLKQREGSNVELTILEKSSRPGGWIETIRQEGFLFEKGPRSIRTKSLSPEAAQLIEELGLRNEIILPHPDSCHRYLYEEQQLKKMPGSLFKIPFSSLTRGWLKAILNEWRAPKSTLEDETIADFFSRRLSPEWAERLVDPFISGIYAGDSRKLSTKSCFPLLHRLEQEHGSLIAGMLKQKKKTSTPFVKGPFFTFRDGMESLIHALAKQLDGEIRLNCGVAEINIESKSVKVKLESGEWLEADEVISALPAHVLARLIPQQAVRLTELNFSTVMVVNLGYRREVLKERGFGYLIPSKEGESILGCVWDSCVFPQQGSREESRLTVMIGGSRHPEVEGWSDTQGIEVALAALKKHCGIDVVPDVVSVKKAYRAIPQYELGYEVLKNDLLEKMGPLKCIGSSFCGASVSDVISSAFKAI